MIRHGVWKFDRRDDGTWTRACLAVLADRDDANRLHITTTATIPRSRVYSLTWCYVGPVSDDYGPDTDTWDAEPKVTPAYRNACPPSDPVIIRPVDASTGR